MQASDEDEWEEVRPLTRRELDVRLAGRINRRDRRYLYQVLDECGLCIIDK